MNNWMDLDRLFATFQIDASRIQGKTEEKYRKYRAGDTVFKKSVTAIRDLKKRGDLLRFQHAN